MALIQTLVAQAEYLDWQNNLDQGTILPVMRESIMKEPLTGEECIQGSQFQFFSKNWNKKINFLISQLSQHIHNLSHSLQHTIQQIKSQTCNVFSYCGKEPPGSQRGSTACDKVHIPCSSWEPRQEEGIGCIQLTVDWFWGSLSAARYEQAQHCYCGGKWGKNWYYCMCTGMHY